MRPTEGMASLTSTVTPRPASASAAINPAGPPPMTTAWGVPEGADAEKEEADMGGGRLAEQGEETRDAAHYR
ncbi:hypothetical protein D3C72_991660 [compost metagenome]